MVMSAFPETVERENLCFFDICFPWRATHVAEDVNREAAVAILLPAHFEAEADVACFKHVRAAVVLNDITLGQECLARAGLEVFLEPICPYSVKAFGKLDDLLDQAGEDRITIKLRLQSQPWHMYSGVIVRCILAASTLESGKAAAKSVMAAVAMHREEFEFERHCRGANLDVTPNDIIKRIERYSGVKLAEAFAIADLDREVKWHCKYARQNGIHVSPTFTINGLVQPDISSGDPVGDWVSRLLKD
jgi:hypothetical protein